MAQIDCFLHIEGVEGGSTHESHRGAMVLEAWGFGCSNASVPLGGGGGRPRAELQELRITKRSDIASPKLWLACCSGQRFRRATLTQLRPGESAQPFITVVLTDVAIGAFQTRSGADESAVPLDEASLSYGAIEYRFKVQNPDGSAGSEVSGSWDVRRGAER